MKLSDLKPDLQNANRGTERGRALLEQSLRQYGAGRSILADKNGIIIAGNKTLETAADLGLDIEVVKTRGERLIVVQREDLDLTKDKAAKELAIADNRVSQVDLNFDPDLLQQLSGEIDLSLFWSEQELSNLFTQKQSFAFFDDAPVADSAPQAPSVSEQPRHPLSIILTNAQKREWDAYKDGIGVSSDLAAFLTLFTSREES